MVSIVLMRLAAVILLVAANAFFVAAEFALVSIRDTRLQQLIAEKRIGARTVLKLHQNLDELLAAVQLGVTLASLGLGWIGEATVADLLMRAFSHVPHVKVYAHGIGIAFGFVLITYVVVILGEVVPKTLALQRADRVALAVAGPMDIFVTLGRPFLRFMSKSASLVLGAFGTHQLGEGSVHSPDELKLMVTASRRIGLLPKVQEDMVHRALELGNTTVREIMVPRVAIFSLSAEMPVEEAARRVVEQQYSRIPVYDPQLGPEHIVGVLYAKDLMRLMYASMTAGGLPEVLRGSTQLRHIMHDVLVIPETKPISDLLVDFKRHRRHLAVVVDEFGSTAGVVSVEDVLEQIVGEIEDEFDALREPPALIGKAPVVLEGSQNIRDLDLQYHLELPRDQGFETLGGFVLSRLQKIPRGGEQFDYQGRRFTVLNMDGRRVAAVKIEPVETAVVGTMAKKSD
ncbi:MAG: hemolysin family protein [Acidobacteriia bacterium]|nr:hemolysin family protein [Terriglobia bacterium]